MTMHPSLTKIHPMKQSFLFLTVYGAAACVASADDVQSIGAALETGLSEQLTILQGMTDASTCAAAFPSLESNFKKLADLNDRVDPTDLWHHIESNAEFKAKLIHLLQSISIEFYRIEQAQFFGCEPLKQLLLPLLVPAKTPEE